MDTIFSCCAGWDVHKQTGEAHVRRLKAAGRLQQATPRWSTMTGDLLAMSDWRAGEGVTHVAMESTGVFWKPIYNILESRFTVLWAGRLAGAAATSPPNTAAWWGGGAEKEPWSPSLIRSW